MDVATSTSSSTLPLPPALPAVPRDDTGDSLSHGFGPPASVRRGLRVARRISSPALATPGDVPAAASHSPPLPPLPAVIVSSSSEGPDDVEPDDPVGQSPPPHLPSPVPQDFLGIASGEVPEELLDSEATASASLPVVQSPSALTPRDIWADLGDQQDAPGVDGNLLAVDPTILVVTPAEFSPVAVPAVDSPVPAQETVVSLSVGHHEASPREHSANSSTEDTPQPIQPPLPSSPVFLAEVKSEPEDIIVISSPEREDRSRSPSADSLKQDNQRLRRQNLGYLRQLKFWVDTVKAIGNHCPRPPTSGEHAARRSCQIQKWQRLHLSTRAWPASSSTCSTFFKFC